MSGQLWVAVVAGAALGAPTRLWVDRRCIARWGTTWPIGTLIVNLLGSAVLGLTAGWAGSQLSIAVVDGPGTRVALVLAFVGTGFCGALTTFSGFAAQVVALQHAPASGRIRRSAGVLYVLASLVGCVLLAAAGLAVGAYGMLGH